MLRRSASVGRFSRVPTNQRTTGSSLTRTSSISRIGSVSHRETVQPSYNFGNKVVHVRKKLASITDLDIPPSTKELTVAHNLLTNLNGLGSAKDLEVLDVSNNKLRSLLNFPYLPKLRSINVQGNIDLMRNEFYRVGLVVLYPTLRMINGDIIRPNELRIAKEYTGEHAALLRAGWQLKYPPPKGIEMRNAKKSIAQEMVAREPLHMGRTAPKMSARVPKKQSAVLDDQLRRQEDEMMALMEEMNKLNKKCK